ncbi:MAG: hypothetical protein GY803_28150 [Chloroflexi bacterium]|nr:hypothetical protein [Chloroflexota bacterium]
MNTQSLNSLFDYHIWANNQVWGCLDSVGAEQFTEDVDYSHGSIQNQLFHLFQTDAYILTMFNKSVPDGNTQKEDYLDATVLRNQWDVVESAMKDALAELTDEQLHGMTPLPKMDGTFVDVPLWEALVSIVNHGTNHRAQILMQLHKLGGKTVEQGFYFYMLKDR